MSKKVKFEIEVDSKGAVTSIKSLDRNLDKLDNQLKDTRGQSDKLGKSFDGIGIKGIALGGIISELSTRALDLFIEGVKNSVVVGMQFQNALAELSAITGIAGDDLEELGRTANEQAIQTGVSANDQIEAYKLLASNIDISVIGGIEGLKMLGKETVRLSQASGVDLATASNTVASAINQFGLEATMASDVVNTLAAGSKFGASEVGDLGESLKNAGTVANLSGLSFEETVGVLEVLSQNAIKGAEAGTGLRNTLLRLQSGSEELADYGIDPLSVKTEGFLATMRKLEPALNDTALMNKIFGEGSIVVASNIIKNADAVGTMTERVTGTNTAIEQAKIQTDTLDNAIKRLIASVKKLQTEAFDEAESSMRTFIEESIRFVDVFGDAFGAVFSHALDNWAYQIRVINDVGEAMGFASGKIDENTDSINKNNEAIETQLTYQEELELESNRLRELQAEADSVAYEKSKALLDKKNEDYTNSLEQQILDLEAYMNAELDLEQRNFEASSRQGKEQEELDKKLLDAKLAGIEAEAELFNQAKKTQEATKSKIAIQKEEITQQLIVTDTSIDSVKAMGDSVLQSMRQQIQASLAGAIASQIQKVITSIPFPFNLAVIPTAVGALNLLFNSLVPRFETGGMVGGRRHSNGGTLIEAEQGEYVVSRNATQEYLPLLEAINNGSANRNNQVNNLANTVGSMNNGTSAQISALASVLGNMQVVLSMYDLNQAQQQFNQVQIQAGVL